MEERLRRLGKKNLSNGLTFTDQHRQNIYKTIHREEKSEEDILIAILQLLHEKRTGFELLHLPAARNINHFSNQEGSLYLLLHELEQKEMIASVWTDDNQKYYQLQQKGKKALKKAEGKQQHLGLTLKDLLKGDLLYE